MTIRTGETQLQPHELAISNTCGMIFQEESCYLAAELSVSRSEFYERVKGIFQNFREEMLEAPVSEEEREESPELYQYEKCGHPSLDFLFIDFPELFGQLCVYIGGDIVQALIQHNTAEQPRWWVRRLHRVRIEGNQIVLLLLLADNDEIEDIYS